MSRFERFAEPAKPKRRGAWDLVDVAVLLGLGLVVAGIALVSKPAALIVAGVVLGGLAVLWPQR